MELNLQKMADDAMYKTLEGLVKQMFADRFGSSSDYNAAQKAIHAELCKILATQEMQDALKAKLIEAIGSLKTNVPPSRY